MKSGIYSLINRENGKRYIGRSVDVKKRKNEHFGALKRGRHPNVHLQRAWNNGARFDFETIEQCSAADLNEREIYWIAKYDSFHNGYNQCEGGKSTTGRPCSAETRRKISEGNKGKKTSEETIRKRTESLKRHLAEDPVFAAEHRRKLSERLKGKPSWNKGRPCPEWKKKQVSEKLKGRYISEAHKENLRELYSGEGSITAKLTKSDVVEIRYRFLSGERQIDICKDYPVTPQTIYDIVRGRRWQSVPMDKTSLEAILKQEACNGNKIHADAGCNDTFR